MSFLSNSKDTWYAYRINKIEKILLFIATLFLGSLMGWLFYEHYIGNLIAILIVFQYMGNYKNFKKNRINRMVKEEFIIINSMLLSELEGGVSLEKSILNIDKRIMQDAGLNIKIMRDELKKWLFKIENGYILEDLIREFTLQLDDITLIQYSSVLKMSRSQGANLLDVIGITNRVLREKSQMLKEVEVLVSEKKLEQVIMSILPFIMLFMLKTISYEFISPLYETFIGRIVMTILLVTFIGCYYWSYRMTVLL